MIFSIHIFFYFTYHISYHFLYFFSFFFYFSILFFTILFFFLPYSYQSCAVILSSSATRLYKSNSYL